MAGISDKQLVTMTGWPAGVDNLSPENDLARDDQGRSVVALRAAENIDLSKGGKPRRREGRVRQVAAARVHSLWHDGQLSFALYVAAGALTAFRPGGTFTVEDGLDPGIPVSYALANERVYWSNGRQRGVVLANGSTAPWECPSPQGQPTAVPNEGAGGLEAGRYQVAITWQLATGEESGAALAAVIAVPTGGGITLSDFPEPPAEIAAVRVYVSPPGGDVLYHAMDLAPGLPAALVGVGRRGKPLDTQFLDGMPSGHIVRWFNGRLYVASGSDIVWSEALRYGLTHPVNNRIGFGEKLCLMEPISAGGDGGGMFVSDGKRTYWLGGSDPGSWSQRIVYPHGAVPGTAVTVPGNCFGLETAEPVPYWLASDGVACLGLPGGSVLPLRAGQAIGPKAAQGASLYRERNGIRQVVTALADTHPHGLVMRDSAVITIDRYDNT